MDAAISPDPLAASTHLHPAASVIGDPQATGDTEGGDTVDSLTLDIIHYTSVPTFVLSLHLVVTHVSNSFCSLTGILDREHLLNLRVEEFCAIVPFPSLEQIREGIRASEHSAGPSTLDKVLVDKTWTLRTVPVIRNNATCCFLMEVQDTTEAHQRQLELEERMYTNETFKILVENVKDYAIFMLDPRGNIATWNAGAQAFKGYTKSEIIGKHFSSFYGQEDRDDQKPERELRDALRDGRCEDEGWRYRKDGSKFWANVLITPVYKDGLLLGFSKVTRDLSQQKKAEAKLIAAYEEASKLKSEFLANMSHEIRTPMHGMLAALTLLLDTKLAPEQLELAQVIEESGEVLLQVINDILDYSKLASGGFSISHDVISVAEIITTVFRAHESLAKPTVMLEKDIDPAVPSAAEGDSLRYRQIVQNMLSNAIKFTEDGYVRIRASLQSEDAESYVILTEVIDTGIGVPVLASGNLFTPFHQFDNSATKRYKGTGLGLSICKSLAELMGGSVGFHSNPEGNGSVFWFTATLKKVKQLGLPPRRRLESKKIEQRPSAPMRAASELKSLAAHATVLLAEDNAINRKVMLKILAVLGFSRTDVASDGNEAVALATQRDTPYDLILMDVNMPFLDGVQATAQIRAKGLHTPIVAMTANALKGQAESYIAKGMTAYVAKPVDRGLLVDVLLGCLRKGGEG